MWQIWLIISGFCLIIEIMTVGFFVFWFAIGALLAMLTSLFTSNLIIQASVFVLSSTILIFVTKPFVQKFVNNKDEIKTNVYSTVGKTGIVIKDIHSMQSLGQVKVAGETWSALGLNNMDIPEGTEVEIKEIKGVKVIVAPLQKSN